MNHKERKWLSDLRMVTIYMEKATQTNSPDYLGMKKRIKIMELEESERNKKPVSI